MEKSGWLGGWASEDSSQLVDAQGMQGCRAVIVEKQVEEAGRERGLAIVFCWCLRTFLALVACLCLAVWLVAVTTAVKCPRKPRVFWVCSCSFCLQAGKRLTNRAQLKPRQPRYISI